MKLLYEVQYTFPKKDKTFNENLISFLTSVGKVNESFKLNISDKSYLPVTSIKFSDTSTPFVLFKVEGRDDFKIEIKNTTGRKKKSPHRYTPITIVDFIKRTKGIHLFTVDHVGFNLPCFKGIHPEILKLRELLKDRCLYHKFPKDVARETWDFILPGSSHEISKKIDTDYKKIRRPKIEIVSFPKSSTPLVQFDVQLDSKYENLKSIFPEALAEPEMRNMWIYLKNNYGIDICFVLNEMQKNDWSFYFKNTRI